MTSLEKLPAEIPVFPLSNFVIFPETTAPLNIFEPRYIQMIDDSMKSNRMIGMIQPKKTGMLKKPDLYKVGCVGKIKSFNETDDGRYLIILNGVSRFKITEEVSTKKLYRVCKINYENLSVVSLNSIDDEDIVLLLSAPLNNNTISFNKGLIFVLKKND